MVVIISDFYESPETIVRTIEPLRFHGNEVVLFHILDPQGDSARTRASPSCWSIWKPRSASKSRRITRSDEYRDEDGRAHRRDLRDRARGAGMDYSPARHRPPARRRACANI